MTHIDTAEMYGDGRSEEIVGAAVRGLPREELFLVSKFLPRRADEAAVVRACEASLRRLGVDYLDCFLLHWRGEGDLHAQMAGLERLAGAGKIRSLGVSNLDPWDLREAAAALDQRRIACNQVLYNLRERTVEDHELPWAREYGCALVAYTPLGKPAFDGSERRELVLAEIGRRRGVSAQAVALAFLLRDPSVFVIPKANRIEHVEANAAAGDLVLDGEEIAALERSFPRPERVGPLPMN
jgi:diketogulonate reductase-like aldo/keto reductase